ncbi:hypothetical protein F5148DRAFT_551601 [Russula earlei]|uniref:Uncharacterized protein n=1 Tax=Russula earlei TaxID=71964 RepID=A0ACC0TXX1_9AGAM|nr:hypothetical protein F5148DRAFT_551601 [Russula earlei]
MYQPSPPTRPPSYRLASPSSLLSNYRHSFPLILLASRALLSTSSPRVPHSSPRNSDNSSNRSPSTSLASLLNASFVGLGVGAWLLHASTHGTTSSPSSRVSTTSIPCAGSPEKQANDREEFGSRGKSPRVRGVESRTWHFPSSDAFYDKGRHRSLQGRCFRHDEIVGRGDPEYEKIDGRCELTLTGPEHDCHHGCRGR